MFASQICIVPSFHYDVAYLKLYAEYLPACFANIDEALRILDAESATLPQTFGNEWYIHIRIGVLG